MSSLCHGRERTCPVPRLPGVRCAPPAGRGRAVPSGSGDAGTPRQQRQRLGPASQGDDSL